MERSKISEIPVFCISLPKKGDKRFNHAKKVIRSLGFNEPIRYDAINGHSLSDETIRNLLTPRAYQELTHGRYSHQALSGKGSIGCYLSHTNLWKYCAENDNLKALVIFEDDINVSENARKHLELGWKSLLNHNWDIFRIVYQYNPHAYREGKSIQGVSCLALNVYAHGLNGYIITPKGAQRLLKKAFPINEHVDYYVNDRMEELNKDSHYFLLPDINKDLGYASHIRHNRICSYNNLNLEFIIWILTGIIIFLWFVIQF